MFPLLAALHAFCAWRVLALRADEPTPAPALAASAEAADVARGGLQILASMPYLRSLALLLMVTTVASGLIDYVFKASAEQALAGDGQAMLRFFAVFYTAVGLLGFLAQTALTRLSLERLGLARTVAVLPLAIYRGLLKALVFSLCAAAIACSNGMRTTGGAVGVGRASRNTVVMALTMTVFLNYLLTSFYRMVKRLVAGLL
jgi:ATP/ADP translocase